MSHVLVHMQAIDAKRYIRILCLPDTRPYFEELKNVYGEHHDDSNIVVYYNCGEAYERLIYDLKFRKFKGVESITPSLWCINDPSLDNTWYLNVYIPIVSNKMATYIEDMEDIRPYFSTTADLISFDDLDIAKYIKMNMGQSLTDGISYTFVGCEETANGYSVINNDHLQSLIFMYINNHSTVDGKSMFTPRETQDEPIKIYSTETSRGLYISKNTNITPKDALDILIYLEITPNTLTSVATSSSYKRYLDKSMLKTALSCEYDPFLSDYSFIDSQWEQLIPSKGDLLTVYETQVKLKSPCLLEKIRMLCGKGLRDAEDKEYLNLNIAPIQAAAVETVKEVKAEPKEVFFYTNILNQGVVAFYIDIQYLPEFTKISNFFYTSPLITNIINIVNESPKETINLVKDLQNLVAVFTPTTTTLPQAAQSAKDPAEEQRALTKAYVERYKEDSTETLASVVIENVFGYLAGHALTHINKNQIGKDLVDLGVKKTRKAKGYVYGIQDSSVIV